MVVPVPRVADDEEHARAPAAHVPLHRCSARVQGGADPGLVEQPTLTHEHRCLERTQRKLESVGRRVCRRVLRQLAECPHCTLCERAVVRSKPRFVLEAHWPRCRRLVRVVVDKRGTVAGTPAPAGRQAPLGRSRTRAARLQHEVHRLARSVRKELVLVAARPQPEPTWWAVIGGAALRLADVRHGAHAARSWAAGYHVRSIGAAFARRGPAGTVAPIHARERALATREPTICAYEGAGLALPGDGTCEAVEPYAILARQGM
jgi:hypothetical protein